MLMMQPRRKDVYCMMLCMQTANALINLLGHISCLSCLFTEMQS